MGQPLVDTCANYLSKIWAVAGRTLILALFAGLELAGLLHPMSFLGESPSYASLKSGRHMSIHRRGRGPASGDIYL
jgi:hypothetical protein